MLFAVVAVYTIVAVVEQLVQRHALSASYGVAAFADVSQKSFD